MANRCLVAVVDDDEGVRMSTMRLLNRRGFDVDTFASGDAFLAADLPGRYDCVLLDLDMPGTHGIDVLRAIRDRELRLKVMVLTGHGNVSIAVEAMRLGAVDFLEKPYNPAPLLDTIALICATPRIPAEAQVDENAREKIARLPGRQRDVLVGILKGQQNKIIAYELGLSIRTVEAYRGQLLANLGVRGTADAVRVALAAGMEVPK